jgi:hypothetical protein
MHSRFLLVPVLAVSLAQSAAAIELQTLEAAQHALFPGATLTSASFTLSPQQLAQLKAQYQVPALRAAVRAWRVSGASSGWLYLDQVYGRDDIVTYLVALDELGRVRGLEILSCAEGYCEPYSPRWRAQFTGRGEGHWMPGEDITLVSGATLSSTHVAEGVKKILAIHARFMPKNP